MPVSAWDRKPRRHYDSNLADDVAVFMEKTGIPKAAVFGYSMDAAAALQLAIRHPEKIEKLVIASTGYDATGWQQAYRDFTPQMNVDMYAGMPFADDYRELACYAEVIIRKYP